MSAHRAWTNLDWKHRYEDEEWEISHASLICWLDTLLLKSGRSELVHASSASHRGWANLCSVFMFHITGDWCSVTIMLLKSSAFRAVTELANAYHCATMSYLTYLTPGWKLYFTFRAKFLRALFLSLLQNLPSLHWKSIASSKQMAKDFENFLCRLMYDFNTQLKLILIWVQSK